MSQHLTVGQQVRFGRSHGEQTLGTVMKINRTTVAVRQDESRGTMRSYPVGTIWKVAVSLVSPVNGAAAPVPVAPVAALPVGVKVGSTVEYTGFSWAARGPALVKGVVTKVGPGSIEVYGNGRTQKRVVGEFTVVGRRTDAEVVSECLSVYGSLSPENLTCDGERSRSDVARAAAELNRALKALFIEAGRQISESECYRAFEAKRASV